MIREMNQRLRLTRLFDRIPNPSVALGIVALLSGLLMTVPASQADAQQTTPPNSMLQMGMHVPQAKDGVWPDVPIGSIRLWDTGVSWREINTAPGVYDWSTLDRVVGLANSKGAAVLYAFGNTPEWAAEPKCLAEQGGAIKGAGANCPPSEIKHFVDFASALAERYSGRIESYEMWNEANIGTFWRGTVNELFDMTTAGANAIRAKAPKAKIVSASVTTRLNTSFTKFLPDYLSLLKAANWPIHAFAVHTYPAGYFEGPSPRAQAYRAIDARTQSFRQARALFDQFDMPWSVEVWDTELNFGLAGPGATPHTDYPETLQATLLSYAYFESHYWGIARTYWFAWGPKDQASVVKFGVTTDNGTTGAKAFQRVGEWIRAGLWDGEFPICLGSAPALETRSQLCMRISKTYNDTEAAFLVVGPGPQEDLWETWYRGFSRALWPTLGPCIDSSELTGPLPRELVSQTPFILAIGTSCAGLGAR